MNETENRIGFILQKAILKLSASQEAKADAEILLAHVLNKSRTHLLAWPEKEISQTELTEFWRLIAQRQSGKPIAYLLGQQEFWSRLFAVNPDVLIPRPETELLIELALEKQPLNVLDLGAGSGAIAITLALELPHAHITAVDFCDKALQLAKINARNLQAENIAFLKSDWFDSIPTDSRFDLILSNPPYIEEGDIHLNQLNFEPITALSSGKEGLDDIRKIIQAAPGFFEEDGWLMLEHGFDQAESVRSLLKQSGFSAIESHCDLQGHERISIGRMTCKLKNCPDN